MSSAPPPGLPFVNSMTPAVLVLPGSLTRDDVPRLCEDVRARLEATGADVVVCDVAGLGPPGLTTVDVLARLQLAARRAGAGYACATPIRPCTRYSVSSASASRWRGSPKSGNHRFVSRKQWNPAIRPPDISRTCTAHGM